MPLVLEPSWIGRRVSVRRVLDRTAEGELRFGDVVGDLVGLDTETAVIEARSGPVEVPVGLVAAARVAVPSTADELALEATVARGWRAAETAELGGWLLRATGGFTSRANSVLPLRAPGRPLDEALDTVRAWYAERGLPARLQLPVEARRLLDAELAERGWSAESPTHVLAARLDMLPDAAAGDAPPVRIADAPDDAWLGRYRGGAATDVARGLLSRHDRAGFAAVSVDGTTLAIGRGTVDGEWLGVTAVEVDESARRLGLATAVMRALWRWGAARGARRSHVEVAVDNGAALALYQGLGYWQHHDYHYRRDPGAQLRTP
jgi:N-acetylglutamate synthase